MLLALLDTLLRDPALFVILAPVVLIIVGGGVLVALTVHEFGHAVTATALGDMTARSQGRVSLNPLRHLDPTGTLMLLLVGFGWGKPVSFNPAFLRYGRRGIAAVAAAGPASNFLTAAILAVPARLGLFHMRPDFTGFIGLVLDNPFNLALWGSAILSSAFFFCILLGVFNLLPLAPLDGYQIALGALPRHLAEMVRRYSQYGLLLLFAIIGADIILRVGILSSIINPVVAFVSDLLMGS